MTLVMQRYLMLSNLPQTASSQVRSSRDRPRLASLPRSHTSTLLPHLPHQTWPHPLPRRYLFVGVQNPVGQILSPFDQGKGRERTVGLPRLLTALPPHRLLQIRTGHQMLMNCSIGKRERVGVALKLLGLVQPVPTPAPRSPLEGHSTGHAHPSSRSPQS